MGVRVRVRGRVRVKCDVQQNNVTLLHGPQESDCSIGPCAQLMDPPRSYSKKWPVFMLCSVYKMIIGPVAMYPHGLLDLFRWAIEVGTCTLVVC